MSIGPITLWLALHSGPLDEWRGTELVNKKKRHKYRRMPITSLELAGPYKVEWTNLPPQIIGWIGIWDQEVGGNWMGDLKLKPLWAGLLAVTGELTLELLDRNGCPSCGRSG